MINKYNYEKYIIIKNIFFYFKLKLARDRGMTKSKLYFITTLLSRENCCYISLTTQHHDQST